VIDANLTSTFLTCKSFLSGMIERRRGAIVTMASNAGRMLDVTVTASYAASKAGIVMFTRHVARELGQYSVRVNCVAPATTMTERVERIMSPERIQHMVELAPLNRIGMPDDVAFGVLYLASDAASWITGITLDVTGGRIML
jgi:3-oxoacyl-[acyl-carrier protein] reductase